MSARIRWFWFEGRAVLSIVAEGAPCRVLVPLMSEQMAAAQADGGALVRLIIDGVNDALSHASPARPTPIVGTAT